MPDASAAAHGPELDDGHLFVWFAFSRDGLRLRECRFREMKKKSSLLSNVDRLQTGFVSCSVDSSQEFVLHRKRQNRRLAQAGKYSSELS